MAGTLATTRWLAFMGLAVLAASPTAGLAQQPAPAPAPSPGPPLGRDPVILTADEVTFDSRSEVVTARGSVELSRGGRRLLAKQIIYDQAVDRVTAQGDVALIEPSGEVFFASSLEVTGDLREATIEGFKALLAEPEAKVPGEPGYGQEQPRPRVAARRAVRTGGNRNELERAAYTACPVCQDRGPLWQIRAERVVHDQVTKTVTYRNATFELMGVPIGWTPYFSHPDPTVERRTGVLTPTFGTNSSLGLTAETPFYLDLAPNRGVTITPLWTTKAGPQLGVEVQDLQTFGETRMGGSITNTDADERGSSGNEVRGHVEGAGRYRLGNQWATGFNLFLASDNTYLQRYDITDQDLLTNDVYVQRIKGGDFLGLSAIAFQGLREGDEQGTFPVVAPLAEARLRSSPLGWGSRLTFDSSAVALTRTDGLDTRRLSNEVGWQVPWTMGNGQLLKFRSSLRGDVYNYTGDAGTLGSQGGTSSRARAVPRATLDWSWPLLGDTAGVQYYLEPATMLTATPYGLNTNRIPNEDSQEFEFDETNLFSPDRFTGIDLVDEGPRVAYGLRFGSLGGLAWDVSGLFGQSWQPREPTDFPSGSGVDANFSDYVGRLDVRPSSLVSVRYRYQIDNEDYSVRRNDVKLSLGPPRFRLDLGYIGLSRDETELSGDDSRREVTVGVRLQPTDSFALAGQVRRDVSRGQQVSNMLGILYNHPCLQVLAGIEQSFTRQGELDDELTFKVRISLNSLGSLQGGT